MESILSKMFKFVISTSRKYNIDESHGLSHSMNVLQYAHNIYASELITDPSLESQQKVIYCAAVLHDMCDKKYMNEAEGIIVIRNHIQLITTPRESDIIIQIIQTMSYSTVKKNGFPDLGVYQNAYHIVREADLLSAYDFDRAIIYDMKVNRKTFEESYKHALHIFDTRVFTHVEDNLFTTEYAKTHYPSLHSQAIQQIANWKHILDRA